MRRKGPGDWHPEDVKAELRKAGLTFRAISKTAGLHQGELVILAYNEGIGRLRPNPRQTNPEDFPKKLSQTGLFGISASALRYRSTAS